MEKTVKFPSTRDNLCYAEKFVDEISKDLHLDDEIYGNVMVSIIEATLNAIIHGNKENPAKEIFISCDFFDDKLQFKVKDSGNGFDFTNLPDPTNIVNIEKPEGRGIFLIQNLADKVNFYEFGRVIEIIFSLNGNRVTY
jgi:serine/threonine-protein kinase RsbW